MQLSIVDIVDCVDCVCLCNVAGNARKNREGVVSRSIVYFTHHVAQLSINSPEPLKLRKILDMVNTVCARKRCPSLYVVGEISGFCNR